MYLSRSVDAIRLTTAILLVACAGPRAATAQSDLAMEPYPAFVVEPSAHARCGPSRDFYRTDPLRNGQEVEVYAETDDGWLGIRPPEESFSWIPADAVELDASEDSGYVIEDRTVVWIGTQLGRARKYRWQVQLAEGESVSVLGESEQQGPDGPRLWYRIVPPSGEYRWLHRDQVVFNSEDLVAAIRGRQTGVAAEAGGPIVARTLPSQSRGLLEPDKTIDPNSSRRQRFSSRASAVPTESPYDGDQPIGSGLAPDERSREPETTNRRDKRLVDDSAPTGAAEPGASGQPQSAGGKLMGAIALLGRPRLLDIGTEPAAPSDNEAAADANWVVAAGRSLAALTGASQPQQAMPAPVTRFADSSSLGSSPPGSVVTAAGQQPAFAASMAEGVVPVAHAIREVTAERIRQIELETKGANVERLNLILSRLMAARATAAETHPLARAARTLASRSSDTVVAGRARLLAERAEQYIRVAYRRDGEVVVRSIDAPLIPGGQFRQAAAVQPPPVQRAPAAVASNSGYLVQVYSARANSPPFALTDDRGRTIAYVTPMPGVNLRTHLNTHVQVAGNQGFVTGLNTPHILATQAVRTLR